MKVELPAEQKVANDARASTRSEIPDRLIDLLGKDAVFIACPAAGSGVHSWMMSMANRCCIAGLSPAEAERIIADGMTRAPKPPNEIPDTIRKAYASATWTGTARSTSAPHRLRPLPITDIEFNSTKLAAIADRIASPRNWRHWLWERSPKRPETQNAFSYLAHLYRDGERVHVFTAMDGPGGYNPAHTITISHPMDHRMPDEIEQGGTGAGIWYLCNPVDGQWHHNPRTGNLSCRSEESVTSFRYAVLESDQAHPNLWLAFVVQLPLRIAAIYTSGGRSIHCLVRVNTKNKEEFDSVVGPLKRPFKVLGGDHNCLSGVRLTRLPACRRPEKNGYQRLLYLCPNPPEERLIDIPPLWNRAESLARWIAICPRRS